MDTLNPTIQCQHCINAPTLQEWRAHNKDAIEVGLRTDVNESLPDLPGQFTAVEWACPFCGEENEMENAEIEGYERKD